MIIAESEAVNLNRNSTKGRSLKLISSTSLLILAFCTAPAFAADSANFTGFTVGVTVGQSHNQIDYSGYIAGKSSSDNSFASGLNAAYGFALSDVVVLSVGASYALSDAKFGQVTYLNHGKTIYVNGKVKDHWSVFVAPGYRFAPQWLGYAKLAYHAGTSDYTDTLTGSGTSKHHGFGYGAGLAFAATRNLELSAEVSRVDLNRESFALSTGEPSITEFSIGANYRF